MRECNIAATPAKVKVTTSKNSKEEADSTLYKQMIGSLKYLCNRRPYIYFSVGVLDRFMQQPLKKHMMATKRVMRYIKGTLDFGILFPKSV